MNLKKAKELAPQKIIDKGQLPIETLLEKGVSAEDIVKEVGQYFKADDITSFVKHFMKIYEISDANVDAREDLINNGIEAQGELIQKYVKDLKLLVEDGKTSYEDIIQTIDDIYQESGDEKNYDELFGAIQEAYGIEDKCKNLWECAQNLGVDEYPQFIDVLASCPEFTDVRKQQVVVDILGGEYLVDSTEGVKDPGNLNERAEQVEKYTKNLLGLVEDNITGADTIIQTIDSVCPECVKSISDQLADKMGWPESLDSTIADYVSHTNQGDINEVIKTLNEIVPEEDKLVVVDALLG